MSGDRLRVSHSVDQRKDGGASPTSPLHFNVMCTDEAVTLIKQYHYSRRSPENPIMVGTFHLDGGLFGDCGPCVAACLFTTPPTRWREPILELSRLCRHPNYHVPLSRLIALTIRHIKRKTDYDLLVSFADWTQSHHGGVYQASGWYYHGYRQPSCDGVLLNGQFIPGRTANALFGSRSPTVLATKQIHVEGHYDHGKFLYWKALTPDGEAKAQRLQLRKMPYPKPDRNGM